MRGALVCLLFVSLAALPAPAVAQGPEVDGAIVFSVFTREQPYPSDLWRIAPDGFGLARLTNDPTQEQSPAWSPDGARIAFVREPGQLWTMKADGSDQRMLTDGSARDSSPSWSPDGRRIVFARQPAELGSDLWTIGADGTGAAPLLDLLPFDPATQPAWSPAGNEVAYIGTNGVSGVDVATGARRLISPVPVIGPLDWAPDASRIAFAVDAPCPSIEIFAVERTGGEPFPLTDLCGSVSGPSYSPNGSRLVVVQASGGRDVIADLALVDASGAAPTTIDPITDATAVAGRASMPDWGPATINAPPDCDAVSVDQPVLRRRPGRFVRVHIEGARDPDDDQLVLVIETVTQDEPVGRAPDARLPAQRSGAVDLRAQSAPRGDGRVYRILVRASDPSGASCVATAAVTVPRRGRAIDSAPPSYDSLAAGSRATALRRHRAGRPGGY